MDAIRVARTAAIAAVVIWTAKALAIWAAGGLDESPLESPLFVLGLVAFLVASAALGIVVVGAMASWLRAVVAVGCVVVALLVISLFDTLSGAVLPDSTGWVQEEAGLWVAALLLLAVVLAVTGRRRARPAS